MNNKSAALWQILLVIPLVAMSYNVAAESAEYTLSRQYGSVFFRVFHQEYLNLVGRFDQYSGTLHLDPDNLADSSLSATVQMGSLNMADKDVTETLVSSSAWFNASIFPEANFVSSRTVVTGQNEVDFEGELSFLGITRPWTLHVKFYGGSDGKLEGNTVGITGKGQFNRLDFGMDQYRNMAADDVEIEVNVKFTK